MIFLVKTAYYYGCSMRNWIINPKVRSPWFVWWEKFKVRSYWNGIFTWSRLYIKNFLNDPRLWINQCTIHIKIQKIKEIYLNVVQYFLYLISLCRSCLLFTIYVSTTNHEWKFNLHSNTRIKHTLIKESRWKK